MANLPLISPELVESYQKEIEEKQSAKTAKRKTASLKRFFDWAKDEGHIPQNPLAAPQVSEGVIITGGEKKKRFTVRTFLMLGILGALIILIFLLARRVRLPIPFRLAPASETQITEVNLPSPSPVPGGVAVLSPWTIFAKMTLADSSGNPITQAQTITFKLYTEAENNGTPAVWTSEPKVLTPDANGNTLIALDNVPTDVFFQNKRLYLAPVTEGTEISQRIPISTANVASNLQEYYPALAAGPLTIPVINSDGALVLASQSPAVKGTAGNLLITGQAVTITTPAGANGNITVSPGGAGIAKFIFGGAKGNFLNASAANLTSGSLYYGVVANNATGYNLLTLESGSSPLTRFSVDAVGNASVSGNLNTIGYVKTAGGFIQTGGNFSVTQAPGEVATITKTGTALSDVLTLTLDERGKPNSAYSTLVLKRYNGANEAAALYVPQGNAIFDNQLRLGRFTSNPSSGIGAGSLIFNTGDNNVYVWNGTSWSTVGSTSWWTMTNGLLYPINPSLDVAIGGTSTASAKFAFINVNSGTPTATISGNLALAVPTGADPAETLKIYNGGKLTVQTSVGGDVGLTSRLTILNGGNVGIGTTNPTTLLQLGTSGTTQGTLGLAGSTSGLVTVQSQVTAGTWTLSLPASAGSSGYVLTTDGTGITTWTAASAIGTSWSSLTAPSTNLSMTMAAWTTTFTWNATTGTNNLFTFQDTASNTGTGYLVNIATATSSTLKPFRVAAAGTEALAINASGNVGIGTTGPVEKLEVTGNTRVGLAPATATTINQVGGIGSGDSSVTVVSTTGYPSQGTLYIDSEAMTYTGTTATSFTGLGRGALGTTAATHANSSTVNNYIATFIANSTTPRMVLTGAGNLAVTGVGQFAGTITSPVAYSRFGTTATTNGLSVASDVLISGKEELNGVFFLNSGNISNSQGTATIQFCITALCSVPSQARNTLTAGSWLVRNTTSGNVGEAALQVDQDMVNQDIFTASASGTPKVTIAYSGNVGVGTTAPSALLHINPTVTATSDFTNFKSGIVYNGASAMTNWFGSYISAPTGTGTITNKYALVTESGAGNVGIGTTNPLKKLQLLDGTLYIKNSSDQTGNTPDINLAGVWGDGERHPINWVYNDGANKFATQELFLTNNMANLNFKNFYNGGEQTSTLFTLQGNGNVGIGTTAPAQLLNVSSSTADAARIRLTETGDTSDTTHFSGLGLYDGTTFKGGLFKSGSTHLVEIWDASARRISLKQGGNVGIGNTSPANLLDIGGTSTGTTYIAIGGTNGVNQANLRTTLGTEQSVSVDCPTGTGSDVWTNFDLGGGAYGFYPQIKITQCTTGTGWGTVNILPNANITQPTTYRPNVGILSHLQVGGTGNIITFAQQRYVQASPPYFIDGYKMNWFIYFLWNKTIGLKWLGWSSEDPPYEHLDGETFETHPHPFLDYYRKPIPAGYELAIIDPTDVYQWIETAQEKKISLLEYLNDYMEVDPTNVTPPTSPNTGNPIRLPHPLVWRKLRLAAQPVVHGPGPAYNPNDNALGDLAERFPMGSGPLMGPGDIVDIHARSNTDPNNILEKTKSAYSSRVAGIISTRPSLVANNQYEPDTPTIPLSLSGQIPVNVSLINGAIKAGDPITSSEIPGLGMKATQAGTIVTRAVSEFDGTGATYFAHKNPSSQNGWEINKSACLQTETCYPVGQVVGLVMNSWYDPDAYLASTGDLKIVGTSQQPLGNSQIPNTKYQILNTANQVIDRIGAFGQLVVANIKAGAIETQDLTTKGFYAFQAQIDNLLVTTKLVSPIVETNLISPLADEKDIHIRIGNQQSTMNNEQSGFGKLIVENASGSAVANVDEGGNATFSGEVASLSLSTSNASISGELYADKIHSTTLDDIKKLLSQVEADQNLLKQAGTWNVNTATSSAKIEELALSNLYVTNQAAINSLSISTSISLGSDFVIQSSSINTLTSPLSLQSLALAPIEIMAGKFRVETNGDVKIQGNVGIAGNLDVGGNITASGSAQFSQVATNRLVIAGSATASGILTGSEIATNGTVGTAQVPANISEITIKNSVVSDQTLVYVSPTSTTRNNVLYVKSKGDGFFTVGFESPLDIDVDFNWWVIETK